jgi:Spy/CpxP family protein refolding chaperone
MVSMVGAAALMALLLNAPGAAQGQDPGTAVEQPGVSPAEIQRLFDAYAAMQAQEQLQLADVQYPQFLTRMKALQEVRRRHQQERNRVLQDLRRLTQQGDADDSQLKDRLKALQNVDLRAEDEVRKAYEAVDAVLTPRQQARFRLFEEQMERRKIELLTRARANRALRKQ